MISKMFIVLYILVQIYFRPALYLYLAQGIYLLHDDDELMLNVLRCHLTY